MKIRVRIRNRTEKIDVGDANSDKNTLGELTSAVVQLVGLEPGSFQLSLNGTDPIDGNPDDPLSCFGIVAGDLIKVLLPEGVGEDEAAGAGSSRPRLPPDKRVSGCINTPRETAAVRRGQMNPEAGSEQGSLPGGGSHSSAEASADGEMTAEEKEAREQLEQLEKETEGDSISEPMLCRDADDGKIPLLLRQLCQENPPAALGDGLCLALHVLMLETGFHTVEKPSSHGSSPTSASSPASSSSSAEGNQPAGREEGSDADLACLPVNWRSGTSYRLHYQHPACRGLPCALAGVSFGTTSILVHGLIGKKIQASTQLKTSSFASIDQEGNTVFMNLPLLSRTFKDTIAYPLLAAMREELGLQPLHGLLAIFPEVQLKILSFLSLPDIMTMSTVCQHFHSLANDMLLWRQMLLRDFGGKDTDRHCNWKSVYKDKYRLKKLRDQLRSRIQKSFYPPGRRPFAFVPPVPNPLPGVYPPGYRGGDYDLYPFRGGGALPGYPGPGFHPVPGPIVPGPRHDPIFPDAAANPRPGYGGGLRDLDDGRPHPYAPQLPQGFPSMPSRRPGGRTGGGSLRGFFR